MADKGDTRKCGTRKPPQSVSDIVSEIEFPYADLENAIELAQTIHSKGRIIVRNR